MERTQFIKDAVRRLLSEIPPSVTILAACKTRSIEEVQAAFEAGINHFGHNYVQEAQAMIPNIAFKAKWHLIGHLQRNKAEEAAKLFDCVQIIDSSRIALELEKHCNKLNKIIPILVEVNSGCEENKTGIYPEELNQLVDVIGTCQHLLLEGLMTMGPRVGNQQDSRRYFIETRHLFEQLQSKALPNAQIHILSMGMSSDYQIAIEEGANIVRLGTAIFGER